ncbi:acyl-CoA desaturase [Marinoscillum sp. MHG1-6]|uniref:fatty acid desaturase family protein n=1 Tax=Marinoscillum sp. MHG1-6 TaxID=2959627 RepID=UPI002157CC55|nr:acyl-CoA desaturase [Marinoscillum sp. MHG1-6]
MKNLKFSSEQGLAFAQDLRQGINQYFKSGESRYANHSMVVKSILILTIYSLPLILLSTGLVAGIAPLFILYIISGLGMAGIGMNIMHDALHGSYAKNKFLNNLMGHSINLIGASASIWKIQHNVLHHTYTNVADADDDLNSSILLRFSPDKKLYWIHRFQFIYAWFFYGLMTLIWVTARDFIRIRQYKKLGFFKKKSEFNSEVLKALAWKITYFTYALALPIIMVPQAWWIVVLAFLCMHYVTGSILSIVFQTAHVMPTSDFPKPDENGVIGNHWSVHQLHTTSNYAPKSTLFSWYIGGLNYQIEHHLMPNICHVHYKGLSKVVKALAKKHGLPYNSHKTFLQAVWDHLRMLKMLGQQQVHG